MITDIREKLLSGKLFKAVIWVMIFVLGGILTLPSLLRDDSGGQWVMRVNGQEVGERDVAQKVEFWKEQINAFRAQYGQYADMFLQSMGMSADATQLAIDSATREELLNQEARRLNLHLDDQYIVERLGDANYVRQVLSDLVPMYLVDPARGINQQQLQAYLRERHISMTDFENKLSLALQRNIMLELILGASYIPTFELKEHYVARNVAKKFSILSFMFADYLKKEQGTQISAQELQAFFDTQSSTLKRYWIPEKRRGTTWKFSAQDYNISVTEQDVAEYYDDNKASKFVETPAQVEVRAIVFAVSDEGQEQAVRQRAESTRRELLSNPAGFKEKAPEVMAAFSRGTHESVFERAAFFLKNNGDISEVIRTKRGFEILQRVGKRATTYKSLSSVRKEIESALLKQKFAQKFIKDAERMIRMTEANDAEIQSFIAQNKGQAQKHAGIEKGGSKLATELFDLKENEYGAYIDGNDGFIVKLTGIDKRHLPTVDSIKDVIEGDIREERAARALEKDLKEARAKAAQESFQTISSSFGVPLERTPLIKKDDANALKALKENGLPADQIFQVEKVGMVQAYHGKRNGFLVRLDELAAFDETDFSTKIEQTKSDLTRERKEFLGQGFVASLYRNATIQMNETRFKQ